VSQLVKKYPAFLLCPKINSCGSVKVLVMLDHVIMNVSLGWELWNLIGEFEW
jgi:hypothetical protein